MCQVTACPECLSRVPVLSTWKKTIQWEQDFWDHLKKSGGTQESGQPAINSAAK
jgi:hypothetical protein